MKPRGVARRIDPSLADAPFISLSNKAFTPDDHIEIKEPVLHCCHRASSAYGHFVFDVLPVIALCREAIRAGRLKVLMPSFPDWGYAALRALGISRRRIVGPFQAGLHGATVC